MLFCYFYDTCPIFAETILPTSKALSPSCIFHSFLMYPKTVRSSSDVGKMTRLLFFQLKAKLQHNTATLNITYIHNKKANLDFISLMT